MATLCPNCRRPVDPETLRCAGGHSFRDNEDGVLVLLSQALAPRLETFIQALRDFRQRQGNRLLDESAYDALPEGEAAHPEWRRRCFDLEVVRPLVGHAPRSILDVGSYNGWLAHGLAQDGHEVTAVDYFTDPYDGLGARRFYCRAPWRSIQMDLKDLSLLNQTYDTVVLNRCLQFFPDPRAYFEHARELVAPGGLLIATGLDIYWDPRRKIRSNDQQQAEYRARYDRDLFLHETRGHLDRRDLHALSAAGLAVRPYRRLWRANLVARAFRDRPRFCFGVWRRAG